MNALDWVYYGPASTQGAQQEKRDQQGPIAEKEKRERP